MTLHPEEVNPPYSSLSENPPNPTHRFTGIFVPAEILEIKELSLFDMILLSWIDALYCSDHGGCFASNAYLGEKIQRAQENTVAKSISKLRKLGLVEDVSFDGRKRVIRARINHYIEQVQSKSALDKNPTRVGQKSNPTLDKNPTYIKGYRKEKRISSRGSADRDDCGQGRLSEQAFGLVDLLFQKIKESDPKFKDPDRDKWAAEIERMHRIDSRSYEEIEALIRFSQNDPFWRTNILSAAKLRKQASQLTAKMKAQNGSSKEEIKEKINKFLAGWLKPNGVDCEILSSYIEFKTGIHAYSIRYDEKGFFEQLESLLRKLGCKQDGGSESKIYHTA